MNGLDNYYDGLLAEHQRKIDRQAYEEEAKEKEMGRLKEKIIELLEENHPAELERLTGYDDTTCKKIVHELYMENFNDSNCWHVERSGDIWVIYGDTTDEWIDEDGEYRGFDTKREAMDYIKETFK
jgi:hypothetical protein